MLKYFWSAVDTLYLCNEDFRDVIVECTSNTQSLANQKKTFKNLINQLLRRVVVPVGGGEYEICAIDFFL